MISELFGISGLGHIFQTLFIHTSMDGWMDEGKGSLSLVSGPRVICFPFGPEMEIVFNEARFNERVNE